MKTLVEINEEREVALDKFLLDAVRMWLVFCTQRYRLYMVLPGSTELDQSKKMKLVDENQLMLTIMPKLQRFGNSKGIELQEISVISGCEGKAASPRE
jgi:hypothetical protein